MISGRVRTDMFEGKAVERICQEAESIKNIYITFRKEDANI